ncbi:MAG: DUF3501 family protein [Parvibaculum sp.]|nr:DUF3501 family protein [Parvibaculum sp.]
MPKHAITAADILLYETYAGERKDRRAAITEVKRPRRIAVGPYATFYFENYATMFHQVHEMLHIERGGAEQLVDELEAYNPLIPNGHELVATLMFEIDDELRRERELRRLTGVETKIHIEVDDARVTAVVPEGEIERTKADGKTSSVHFLHFPFTPELIAKFRDPATRVLIGISHEHYNHLAVIDGASRVSLSADFD